MQEVEGQQEWACPDCTAKGKLPGTKAASQEASGRHSRRMKVTAAAAATADDEPMSPKQVCVLL